MLDGHSLLCGVIPFDHNSCGIYLVATRETACQRGFARTLMRRALHEARERGCATSMLQASAMGGPLYARLGTAISGNFTCGCGLRRPRLDGHRDGPTLTAHLALWAA